MWYPNKLNPFNFLIFVSLIHWIRGELADLKEEITGVGSEKNDTTTVTFATTDEEILDKKIKSHELSVKERKPEAENNLPRRTRDIELVSLYSNHLEIGTTSMRAKVTFSPSPTSTLDCYYCSASSSSSIDDPCYEGDREFDELYCKSCDMAITGDAAENDKCLKGKQIPSMVCENDRDKCYSLHTPFGIVDRGCFDIQKNVSVYVCSCNHCNSKSINDMPVMFDTKQDWIKNVIDLSYLRRLKRSILKEISCLHCEVQTAQHSDRESADCVDGNVNSVPTITCNEKEICGIKAIRSVGYIWRGCIESPLYNYWITYCDFDLCNYDELVSVYDTD
ncbi:uncharacterized protein LOC113229791 [Hyposmocoma kahamanoa]|uniref:uncharacterized protein LOC113229791 n=1 Tax=Hyposmocoma kahamanoa TaxID=1477025 RepID=UPI000E6D9833|nr:uncharacterized protein LOC113229791 [Hyposmocoma kahamanoa]